jgi:uncharacterized protein YecE (DUF72 family)
LVAIQEVGPVFVPSCCSRNASTVRLHGPDRDHLYRGSYCGDDLRWWADRIGEWQASGRDVYAYFNNDGQGHAVRNADTLRAMVHR